MIKKQHWFQFTLDDKVNLLYDVLIGQEKVSGVAKRYCRTKIYVSHLVTRIMKNRNLLTELIEKRDESVLNGG